MIETAIDIMETFKNYGLEVEEIEPAVYKVLNTNQEVNITQLQFDLECCVLITSKETQYKKLDTGENDIISYIYYIILDYDNRSLGFKYNKYAMERFGRSLIVPYKNTHKLYGSIDTIYAKGEI